MFNQKLLPPITLAAVISFSGMLFVVVVGRAAPARANLTLGDTSMSTDGTLTINGVPGSAYLFGPATTTGTITIGGTAQTGTIRLGSSTAANTILIGSGTGATTTALATGNTSSNVGIGTASPVAGARVEIAYTDATNDPAYALNPTAIIGLSSRPTFSGDLTTGDEYLLFGAKSSPASSGDLSGGSILTQAGLFSNPSSSAATADGAEAVFLEGLRVNPGWTGTIGGSNDNVELFGIKSLVGSNLGTIGTTAQYGAYLSLSGTADNNYGLFVNNVSGATNNYAIYAQSGTSYFAESIGIGTNVPTELLDINSDSFRLRTAQTPASAAAACAQGQIAWDSGFIYVCVATNTWKRAAIASW